MGQQSRVLLLEDDLDILELTSELLESTGLQVTRTMTIHEAHEQLLREAYEIVLTDFLVDSATAADSWRGIQRLHQAAPVTPIGILTGAVLAPDELARHPVSFVLKKPFTSEDLLEAVGKHLATPPISDARQEVLRSYFSCLERSSWNRLSSLCAPDVVYNVPGDHAIHSRTVHGVDELQAVAVETFANFVEPRFAITAIRPLLRDAALVRYDGSWRLPDDRRTELPGAVFFRFAGDTIAEIGVRLDLSAIG